MRVNGERLEAININQLVESIFGSSIHKKRIASIANAALGIIASASLIIHRVGRGMADALNLSDKHAIKQVDRLLSNTKFNTWDSFQKWGLYIIGGRKELKIAMDWTDFDGDNQTTLSMNLVTSHGRATPLLWKTYTKKTLKNNRNNHEDELLLRLRDIIPEDVKVTILADRGFCDIKLMDFLKNELKFDYNIRIRSNIIVFNEKGERKLAGEWITEKGTIKTLRNVKITHQEYHVPTVVCVHDKKMKAPWCIASSDGNISGSSVVKWYAKRWGCEPQFRDVKDIHFGMGLSETNIRSPQRRDRLLFIHAISTVILTFLGAAGENIGLDRLLKANTVKRRTLSLFRQGCIYFNRLEKMYEETLKNLLNEFYKLIEENKRLTDVLGVV